MKNSQTTTSQSAASTGASPATDTDQSTIIYKAPFMWRADNRKRRFISLPERQFSHKTDWEILCRSVDLFLQQQDERGSFYTEEDYHTGDRVDDHLGAASALAYFLFANRARRENRLCLREGCSLSSRSSGMPALLDTPLSVFSFLHRSRYERRLV